MFLKELAKQNLADHAIKARRERNRHDVVKLLTGRATQAQVTVLVIGTAVYFAHKTELDKKLYLKAKAVTHDVRTRWTKFRHNRRAVHPK